MAMRNLLDNALKHAQVAGVQGAITLEVGAQHFSVSDHGPGIAPDQFTRLLQPGERGLTDAPGSGLGLALVQRIAQAHGAQVQCDSPLENGRGLKVSVVWPAKN